MQLQSLAKSTEALNKITNVLNNTELSSIAIQKELEAIGKSYTTETLKAAIAQSTLKKEQIETILSANGLQDELLETTVEELANAASTNAAAASQANTTATTLGLSTAFKGLAASLGISTVALGALIAGFVAVEIAFIAFNKYKQHIEEVRQATQEAANTYKESSSSIDDYISQYQQLHKALIAAKGNEEETYTIKEQLLELQKQINETFGDEYDSINLVTDAYKDQTEAIRSLNKESAQKFLDDNREGIKTATDKMTKERHYNLSYTGLSGTTDKGEALIKVAKKYEDQGITLLNEYGDDTYTQFSIHLNADAQSAYDTIHEFLGDLRDEAKRLNDEHMFDDVFDVSSDALNKSKQIIDEYRESYRQGLMAEIVADDDKTLMYNETLDAVEQYNEAVLKSKNPLNDEDVDKARQHLKEIQDAINGDDSWNKYSVLINDVFDQADTRILDFNKKIQNDSEIKEFVKNLEGMSNLDLKSFNPGENESFDKLKSAANEYDIQALELIDTLVRLGYIQDKIQDSTPQAPIPFADKLTTSQDALDKFQSLVKSAYDAYSTLLSGNYSSSDLLDSIQAINQAAKEMGKSIDWDFIAQMDADGAYDSIELLGGLIEDFSEDYAKSVLSNAGIDINSDFGKQLADGIIQSQKAQAEFEAMNAQIDRLQSSYQSLTGILDSYNESGYFSLDNLQSLLTADENLITMLQLENGQLTINQTAYENLVAAQLLEFKEKLSNAAAAEIEALAKGKSEEATKKNADASNNAVAKLDAETSAFHRNSSEAIRNAIAKTEEAGTSDEEIQAILDKYNKVWDATVDGFENGLPTVTDTTKSAAKEVQKEVDIMSELNSEMNKLKSAYKTLCDIRDTYNEQGRITVDQYTELTDMGFGFLANLIDENGQLGLNTNAFEKLSNAKLQEMQIQLARNAVDTINGIKNETEATEYLTYANENLRDAALDSTEALLYQAQAMAHLRGEQQGLAADQVVQGYEASKKLISKVEFDFDASKTEKESFSKTYNWIENLLSSLSKKTSALIDKAENFISWSMKNTMINRAVKASNKISLCKVCIPTQTRFL